MGLTRTRGVAGIWVGAVLVLVMLLGSKFPETERVAAGIPARE